MEQNSRGQRTGRPNHPVRRRPPLNREALSDAGRFPQQGSSPFPDGRPLLNPADVPRKKKKPPLNPDGTPRRKHRPLNPDGTPRRHSRSGSHKGRKKPNFRRTLRKLRRSPLWLALLAAYALILIVISGSVVKRVRNYMTEYEASRPQYVMDDYVKQLDAGFYNTMLHHAAGNLSVSRFETAENVIAAMPSGSSLHHYTYQENREASNPEKPVYDICCGGKAIASVALTQSGKTPKYGLPLWSPGEPVSRITVTAQPQYALSVTMPADAVLTVNGVTVDAAELAEAEPEITFDQIALKYGPQPENRRFTADGFYLQPEVTVTDATGNRLTPQSQPAPEDPQQTYVFERAPVSQPDDAIVQRVNALTMAYFNYISNNGRNGTYNLSVLSQYMMYNSPLYWTMANITEDIKWNNQYTQRDDKLCEIASVTMYSDTLCVCEVNFDIVLTKVITNEYKGTLRWTLINNGYNWFAEDLTLMPLSS